MYRDSSSELSAFYGTLIHGSQHDEEPPQSTPGHTPSSTAQVPYLPVSKRGLPAAPGTATSPRAGGAMNGIQRRKTRRMSEGTYTCCGRDNGRAQAIGEGPEREARDHLSSGLVARSFGGEEEERGITAADAHRSSRRMGRAAPSAGAPYPQQNPEPILILTGDRLEPVLWSKRRSEVCCADFPAGGHELQTRNHGRARVLGVHEFIEGLSRHSSLDFPLTVVPENQLQGQGSEGNSRQQY
ncbi:hypothetical protein FB451DRAFT_1185959 [Mycena latifolia]|nr:hypothetical protein FB451DRAFT_1185959 [Mycena latifolia]